MWMSVPLSRRSPAPHWLLRLLTVGILATPVGACAQFGASSVARETTISPDTANSPTRASAGQDLETRHEERSGLGYGVLFLQDTWNVLSAPGRWDSRDWLTASAAVVVIGTAGTLDRPVRDKVLRHRDRATGQIADVFERFGAEYSFGVPVVFFISGLALENPKAKDVAFDALAANLIAGNIVTPAFKEICGRYRPSESGKVYNFRPFSGHDSFPSGHTTRAFAVASVIATHYDHLWVKITSYGIASMVGLARIEHNVHFASDVAAGALIGTAIGRGIVHFNQAKRGQTRAEEFSIALFPDQGRLGVHCKMVF